MDGYVTLNGKTVWKSAWCANDVNDLRGITLLVIHPVLCTVLQEIRFDTHGDHRASLDLSQFLEYSEWEYLVGVTADEPTNELHRDGINALYKYCYIVVDHVPYRAAFVFVTKKDRTPGSVTTSKNFSFKDCVPGPSLTYYIPDREQKGSNYTVL